MSSRAAQQALVPEQLVQARIWEMQVLPVTAQFAVCRLIRFLWQPKEMTGTSIIK